MDANNELLQAIGQMMDSKLAAALEPIRADIAELKQGQAATNARLDTMQADIEQIKEDTAITRETTNSIGEWTEAAADVLKIKYPIQ